MPIGANWIDPSAGGLLDVSNGTVVTQTHWDYIADNLLYLGGSAGKLVNFASSTSVTAYSTSSSTPAVLTSPSVTITTTGTGPVVVMAGITTTNITLNAQNFFYVVQDSVIAGPYATVQTTAGGAYAQVVVCNVYAFPGAATHVYQPGWACNAGTLSTNSSTVNWLIAMEFRR